MTAHFKERIAELDRVSRTRALTYAESLELEREITFANGQKLPRGLTKALARQGIKRGMQRYGALAAAAREGGDVQQAPAESPQSGPSEERGNAQ